MQSASHDAPAVPGATNSASDIKQEHANAANDSHHHHQDHEGHSHNHGEHGHDEDHSHEDHSHRDDGHEHGDEEDGEERVSRRSFSNQSPTLTVNKRKSSSPSPRRKRTKYSRASNMALIRILKLHLPAWVQHPKWTKTDFFTSMSELIEREQAENDLPIPKTPQGNFLSGSQLKAKMEGLLGVNSNAHPDVIADLDDETLEVREMYLEELEKRNRRVAEGRARRETIRNVTPRGEGRWISYPSATFKPEGSEDTAYDEDGEPIAGGTASSAGGPNGDRRLSRRSEDPIDVRLNQVDIRFNQLDWRMNESEAKTQERLNRLEQTMADMQKTVKEVREQFESVVSLIRSAGPRT